MDNSNFIIINIYYHEVKDYIEYFSIFEGKDKNNIIVEFSENSNTNLYELIKEELDYVLNKIIQNKLKYDIKVKINIPQNIRAHGVYYTISDIYNKIKIKYKNDNYIIHTDLYIEVEDKINSQTFNCKAL